MKLVSKALTCPHTHIHIQFMDPQEKLSRHQGDSLTLNCSHAATEEVGPTMSNQFSVGIDIVTAGRDTQGRNIDGDMENTKEGQGHHSGDSLQNGVPVRLSQI